MSYKGPPTNGVVEIGYSVVPLLAATRGGDGGFSHPDRGGLARGAEVVVAHTFAYLEPSLGVLGKLGFEPAGSNEAGELEFRLRRP